MLMIGLVMSRAAQFGVRMIVFGDVVGVGVPGDFLLRRGGRRPVRMHV